MAEKKKIIIKHTLVPEHVKLSEDEKKELLEFHNITIKDLPKILVGDPAIKHLEAVEGDIIKILRISPTSGSAVFYRGVINE
jgi:DNA-directed RNA polymerase subunit H